MSAPCEAIAPLRAGALARLSPPPGLTAEMVAAAYLRDVTAYWQGASTLMRVRLWLERYWSEMIPPLPVAPPVAISPHGGGGRGIWWYETEEAILGYIPACAGGYRIPRQARMPEVTVGERSDGGRRSVDMIERKSG